MRKINRKNNNKKTVKNKRRKKFFYTRNKKRFLKKLRKTRKKNKGGNDTKSMFSSFSQSAKDNVLGKKSEFENFFAEIPPWNQKILLNKLLTLSLDDSDPEMNKLETQQKRVVDDFLSGITDEEDKKKIRETHRLNLLIEKYNLSSEKLNEMKIDCFRSDNKNTPVTLLTEKLPIKEPSDGSIKYHKQEYIKIENNEAETNTSDKDENSDSKEKIPTATAVATTSPQVATVVSSEPSAPSLSSNDKSNENTQSGGGTQLPNVKYEIQYQNSDLLKTKPIYRVSEKEEEMKKIVEEEGSNAQLGKDRDDFGIENKFPVSDSFYNPMIEEKRSRFKQIFDSANDIRDTLQKVTESAQNKATKVNPKMNIQEELKTLKKDVEKLKNDSKSSSANLNETDEAD